MYGKYWVLVDLTKKMLRHARDARMQPIIFRQDLIARHQTKD